MIRFFEVRRALARGSVRAACGFGLAAAMLGASVSASAQDVESFDPDEVYEAPAQDTGARSGIDADLMQPEPRPASRPVPLPGNPANNAEVPAGSNTQPNSGQRAEPLPENAPFESEFSDLSRQNESPDTATASPDETAGEAPVERQANAASDDGTVYAEDDLIGAAEGVFGKGAEGLARLIEDLLKKEGKPNAYIVGREAGGAFVVGARYGSGTLHHKIEGERKVYWTGPSIGFDAGANAAKTFVLVYNLFDTEDLFKRFPAGEGQAYFVGGLHASYMRWGDVVLIPIRLGAGVRLGVNAGYMRFSKKQRWLPF